MKVLVCARHFGYLRNFESALIELASRGHRLHLAADREESSGGLQMVERLAARFPGVTVGWTPRRDKDAWLNAASGIRLSQDYLRFLDRAYDKAPMLRKRSKERTPQTTIWLVEHAGFRFRPGRRVLAAVLDALEDAVPVHEPYSAFLAGQAPDVVVLTPLIDLGSPQLDLLKSARALGLRTVLAVGSWDHLSSKALVRMRPDLVTVWNGVQRDEAHRMHGLPADLIAVTGAQCYDQWFGRSPSRTREAFCRDMALPPDKPFVLYVCSSLFRGDPPEADFAVAWIRALRDSRDPWLADLGILVRPHPGRLDEWAGHDVASLGVAFHGSNPIDDEARADYFDALFYSAAVVGLNTSAFIEAGIVGRPVLAVLPKAYWKSQEGTLHFSYLTGVGGGLLQTSRSIEEHVSQLAAAVAGEAPVDHRGFVEAFIRPYGVEQPGAPRFADAIERLASSPGPRRWRPSVTGRAIGPIVRGIVRSRAVRGRGKKLRKDTAHAVQKARERVRRASRVTRKRWRDARTSTRLRFRPSTRRRTLVWPDEFERSDRFEELVDALARLQRSPHPIVVGPWLSEVGFELLYWIPFLRWAKARARLRADRLIILSRGGTASWYRDIGTRYVDIFDLVPPDEFQRRNRERIADGDTQKHYTISGFDRDLHARLMTRSALARAEWLHPRLMYETFRDFWSQVTSSELVRRFTSVRRLDVPPLDQGLPARYVAVKFYENAGLSDSPAVRQQLKEILTRITREMPAVVLQSGLAIDDHAELGLQGGGRVIHLDRLLTPATNLDVQTRAVAGATAFVSTYGGFSYLGPFCGVPTLSFYTDARAFRQDHLALALRTFRDLAAPSFVAMDLADVAMVDRLLGRAAAGTAMNAPIANRA